MLRRGGKLISVMKAPEVIGIGGLLQAESEGVAVRSRYTARTISSSTLWRLDVRALRTLLTECPELKKHIDSAMRFRRFREQSTSSS